MESRKNISSDTGQDSDETLVTPRFDSGEAETAQPVVPLAVVSGEADTYATPPPPAAGYATSRVARRASLPLALVLVSALAGSVLGGVALYLFQKSRQQSNAPAETQQQTQPVGDAAGQAAPVTETTPAPSPAPEETGALAAGQPEEVAEVPDAVDASEDKDESADAKRDDSRREARDDKEEEAAPRERSAPAPAPAKRGKKGDRDDDDNPSRETRPRRVADDDEDDGEYYDDGGARRVGSIVYDREARRERRRQRRQASVDRVRGIFEGQP